MCFGVGICWYHALEKYLRTLNRHFDVFLLYIDILNPISSPNISGTQNGGNLTYKLYGYSLCKGTPTRKLAEHKAQYMVVASCDLL